MCVPFDTAVNLSMVKCYCIGSQKSIQSWPHVAYVFDLHMIDDPSGQIQAIYVMSPVYETICYGE